MGAGQDLASSPSEGAAEAAPRGSRTPQPVLSGLQTPLGFSLQSQEGFIA